MYSYSLKLAHNYGRLCENAEDDDILAGGIFFSENEEIAYSIAMREDCIGEQEDVCCGKFTGRIFASKDSTSVHRAGEEWLENVLNENRLVMLETTKLGDMYVRLNIVRAIVRE